MESENLAVKSRVGSGFGWLCLIVLVAGSGAVHLENRRELNALAELVRANEQALGETRAALNDRTKELADFRIREAEWQTKWAELTAKYDALVAAKK